MARTLNPSGMEPAQTSDVVAPGVLLKAASNRSVRLLLPSLLILVLYYCLTIFGALGRNTSWVDAANIIGPIGLIVFAGLALHESTKRYPVILWTPFAFYLANIIVFSGLGPLVYYLGNEATITRLQNGNFALSDYELLRTNLLNAVGISSAILGFYLYTRLSRYKTRPARQNQTIRFSVETLTMGFLLVGGVLRYLVFLPFQFGMTDFVLPGIFNNLQHLFDLGLALCAYLTARKSGGWGLLLWVLLPLHLSTTVLQFSKSAVVLALMLPALGAFLAHASRRRLLVWVVIIVATYSSLQPLVEFGRGEIAAAEGNISQASLAERLQITQRFLRGERSVASMFHSEDEQSPWMRIAYSGPQAYAMRERDQGREFDTFSNIWVVFVPRVFWPDKPVGIGPGDDFYQLVTGRDTTLVGVTIYADAYWNVGWAGVILVSGVFGLLLGLMSHWTLGWLTSGQYVFLPAIFLAIIYGLMGPNGWVVNRVFGPLPIYFAYVLGIYLLIRFIRITLKSTKARGLTTPHRKLL